MPITLEQLHEDLVRMSTVLERLDRELLGDGQPGRVQILEAKTADLSAKITAMEARQEERATAPRLNVLERSRWIAVGLIAAVAAVMGGVGGQLRAWLLK